LCGDVAISPFCSAGSRHSGRDAISDFAMKFLFALPFAAASITLAHAQTKTVPLPPNLPKVVQDAVEKNNKECEEGKKPVFKPGFLTRKDINGDGKPDYILNYDHFQCDDLVSLFCGTGGCLTEIFVTDDDNGYVPVWNEMARRIRFAVVSKRPAMLIDLHGSACGRIGAERCAMTLYWNGMKFHPAN
jgi:hypothetical protein